MRYNILAVTATLDGSFPFLEFSQDFSNFNAMSVHNREVFRFIVAGCMAVFTDFAMYYLLLNVFSHSPAKAISFLSGTIVAYYLNKVWTWEKKGHSWGEMSRFGLLYLMTLTANVAVNKISLILLPGAVLFGFLAATGTSTILNFIGQKWWVFTGRIRVSTR